MSDQDLKDAILRLTELVASQQQQISQLNRAGQANQPGSEKIIESLATGIEDFYYDPNGGVFFDAWYARYEDVFKIDGKNLDDQAKVRLLLRKIGTQFHERYVNSILPKHPRDFGLDETVKKLKKIYGRQTSLFNDRYHCLQYIKNEADDFSSYAASVNKKCEAFQLSKLSDDQFKALRFVCGLQSARDADIRTRLISKLEAEENAPPTEGTKLTLENLVEECHRFNNLKQDTKMIEKPVPEKSVVNAVSMKPAKMKQPKYPCWFCGDLHFVKECPYQDHFCSKCKKKGHKEGYCASAESKFKSEKTFLTSKPKDFVKSNGISVKRIDLQEKRKFITIGINGNDAVLQLDCASDVTIISTHTWEAIGKPAIEKPNVIAISASGNTINIMGKFVAELTIQHVTNTGIVYVSSNPDLNILGIDTIDLFDLWSIPFKSLVNAVHRKPKNTAIQADVKAVLSNSVSSLPVTSEMIAAETSRDPALQSVIFHINEGWPNHSKAIDNLVARQFFTHRNSLQLVQGCVMFGDRVVVPERFRKRILQQLHRGHQGMDRMKSLARSFVYWPNIDGAVEGFVRCCRSCAEAAKSQRKTDLESWPIPSKPWDRVHIDYAGPIDGYYYFLIIDAYSKWPEIIRMRSTTTTATIEMLQEIFARFGNPRTIVSDNGTQFVSSRFKQFCDETGITHLTIAPYHPQSNGQAERFVDTLKRGLKKLREGGNPATFQHLQTFLSVYRSTPNSSAPDHKSPAELFLGRSITTTLDLLKPREPTTTVVNRKQNSQFNLRHGTIKREFAADDLVFAEVHHRNEVSWVPGKVIEKKGSVIYAVLLENGRLIRSHTNQLKQRYLECTSITSELSSQLPWTVLLEKFNMSVPCAAPPADDADPEELDQPAVVQPPAMPPAPEGELPAPEVVVEEIVPESANRTERNRRLPAWLAPYNLF